MKCPYCDKEALVSYTVKLNLERYGGSVKARTSCCGALIRVFRVITFRCGETDQGGKDDWGE